MKHQGLGAKYIRIQKKEMVHWAHRLAQQGIFTGFEGNLSLKLGQEHMLITRSMADKKELNENDILLCNVNGELMEKPEIPDAKISTEYLLHQQIYKTTDSRAIVHAHPLYATMLGMMEIDLTENFLAEPIIYFGSLVKAEFAKPGTSQLAQSISPFLPESRAILLSNHGAVTHDEELSVASNFMEMLEKVCHIYFLAWQQKKIGIPVKHIDTY